MKILITGGTGLIGSNLANFFIAKNYHVTVLTRNAQQTHILPAEVELIENLSPKESYDVIINLAGYPLNKKRWSKNIKQVIYDSRIDTTRKIIDYLSVCEHKPQLLLNGSAIGIYGTSEDKIFNEESLIDTQGFAGNLCASWEKSALEAEKYGGRVCLLRTGIVLATSGGALGQMLLPFKLGLGAVLGNGQAWMSWIHMADLIAIIDLLINNQQFTGAFNLTSPQPVTNKDFSIALAKTLHRPLFLRFPELMVRLMFGEMADALLLNGSKVMPWKIIQTNYQFQFPNLKEALTNLLR